MKDEVTETIHFLGTAGYHPGHDRQTSCIFLPHSSLMLDAGTGIFRAIPLIQKESIDILISHAHLDHVFGLTVLLDLVANSQLKKVRVFGEREKLNVVRDSMLNPLLFPAPLPIEWCPLEDFSEAIMLGDAKITWTKLEHPGGCIGYRVDWPGYSLAYITDTTARHDSSYWRFVEGVDCLIHECNFSDDRCDFAEKTGHSCLTPVLNGATAAKVKQLVLTHLPPLATEEDPIMLTTTLSTKHERTPDQVVVADDRLILTAVRLAH